jgi:uncharacterized membrane protein YjjP (DUF1212 family)
MDLRVGYTSLIMTLGKGEEEVTRVVRVGPLGVNQRFRRELGVLAARIRRGEFSIIESRQNLQGLLEASVRYPDWFVAISVGIACAAFGRLLDVDWKAVGPIFFSAAFAHMVRRQLALRNINLFISSILIGFCGAVLSGLGAQWVQSQTVARDMVATVLLLVPGVPAFNAELDILDGRPTLGSARAIYVFVTVLAMAIAVWLALGVLREGR